MITIDDKIDELLTLVRAMARQPTATNGKSGKWEQGGGYADDALLDGQYGKPAVFKSDPREWEGPSYVGVCADSVPPEYGRLYADMCDRFGDKAKAEGKVDKNGKALYWRKYQEAAIFRGWAKRNDTKPAVQPDDVSF